MLSKAIGWLALAAVLSGGCVVGDIGSGADDVDGEAAADAEALAAKETVSIDLSKPIGKAERRAMGFLCGLSPQGPGDAEIEPLGMTFSRGDGSGPCLLSYGRLHAPGVVFDRLLADDWNNLYNPDAAFYGAPWPGDGDKWAPWEKFVRQEVKSGKSEHIDWEIWNEPDGAFWQRSHGQYLEMWRRAYEQIRAVVPHARIVGPSLSKFRPKWMADFLKYAAGHGVLPDVISWHELDADSPPKIKGHVEELQSMAHPYYGAHVPVHINEYVDNNNKKGAHQYSPGQTIYFIANLERAQVEHAGHSCWWEIGGGSNCVSGTLSGLLTSDGKRQRRSTWWAYQRYARISGDLFEVSPSAHVDGLAGMDDKGRARILVGNHSDELDVPVSLHVTGLPDGKAHVLAESIHYSGIHAAPAPKELFKHEATITGGTLVLSLPGTGKKGAWSIDITREQP